MQGLIDRVAAAARDLGQGLVTVAAALVALLFGHRSAAYDVASGQGGPETRGELTDAEVLEQLEGLRADGRISPEDHEALTARHRGGPPLSPPPTA